MRNLRALVLIAMEPRVLWVLWVGEQAGLVLESVAALSQATGNRSQCSVQAPSHPSCPCLLWRALSKPQASRPEQPSRALAPLISQNMSDQGNETSLQPIALRLGLHHPSQLAATHQAQQGQS